MDDVWTKIRREGEGPDDPSHRHVRFIVRKILNDGSTASGGNSGSGGSGGVAVLGDLNVCYQKNAMSPDTCRGEGASDPNGPFPDCSVPPDDMPAVLKLNHAPLPRDARSLESLINKLSLETRLPYSGSEYAYYNANYHHELPVQFPLYTVEVICANMLSSKQISEEEKQKLMQKHIARSTAQQYFIIRETPEMYENVHRYDVTLEWAY